MGITIIKAKGLWSSIFDSVLEICKAIFQPIQFQALKVGKIKTEVVRNYLFTSF